MGVWPLASTAPPMVHPLGLSHQAAPCHVTVVISGVIIAVYDDSWGG